MVPINKRETPNQDQIFGSWIKKKGNSACIQNHCVKYVTECALTSAPPYPLQELKQDISSFRYEVLDLLGNRKPPRRTYSSSSEATQQDEEPAEDLKTKNPKGVSFSLSSSSSAERKARESEFGVSALFRSMSGTTVEASLAPPPSDDRKPKSNGLRKFTPSASFIRNNGRLQRFSRSKKDSLRRLGLLFSRMNGHLPEPPSSSRSAYSISDGVDLRMPSDPQVTRSEMHLHRLGGLGLDEIGAHGDSPHHVSQQPQHQHQYLHHQQQQQQRQSNGRDGTLLLRPPLSSSSAGQPSALGALHCASSITASSSRLLSSSEDMCEGWVGPCDSLGSISWTGDQEESVTTQL